MMQQALPFIEILDDNSFVVNPEASSLLRAIDNRISVVCSIGAPHSGKSALLNFLHNGKSGFKIGDPSTGSHCTRGIWMWISNTKSKGRDVTLITLDTEGLFAQSKEGTHDAKIFSLAILFSTTLIYNCLPGALDDNSVACLALMNKLPEIIRNLPGTGHSLEFDENIFRKLTPSFCWLLRDFERSLVDSTGLEVTPLQYMEEFLQSRSGYDRKSLESTRLKKILTTLFPDRMCKVLARPLFDEVSIKHIERCPAEMLRAEFLANLEDFQNYVFSSLEMKSHEGKHISGAVFSEFAHHCVKAINSTGAIQLKEAWNAVAKSESENAVEQSIRLYLSKLSAAATGIDADVFERCHDNAMVESMAVFEKSSVGEHGEEMRNVLRGRIFEERKRLYAINYQASATASDQLARELFHTMLRPQLYPDSGPSPYEADPQALKDDWHRMADVYYAKSLGPAQKNVFGDMSYTRMTEAVTALTRHMRDRYEGQLKVQQVLLQNLETKLASKIVDEHALRSSAQSNGSRLVVLEAKLQELTNANKDYLLRLDDLEALKSMADRDLTRTRDVKDRLEEKLVDLRAKLLTKSNAYDDSQRVLTDLGVQVQSLQRKLDQEIAEKTSMKHELDVVTDKLLKAESMSFGKSGSGEALDSFTVMQSQINTLQSQLRALSNEKSHIEIQLRSERDAVTQNLHRVEEVTRSKMAEMSEEISYHKSEVLSKDKILNSQEEAIRQTQKALRESTAKCMTIETQLAEVKSGRGLESHDNSKEHAINKQQMEAILTDHRALVEDKSKEVMSLLSSVDSLKREQNSLQRDLATAVESKRSMMEDFQREKERLMAELSSTQQSWEAEKRRTDVILQTQRANIQSSGSSMQQLEKQIADLHVKVGELESKDQFNAVTIEELTRTKKETEELLIRERAARQLLDKRLADGLTSLDSTSRNFQELQYAYETLLSESSAQKTTIEKHKLIATNATSVAEKASAEVAEAVRAIGGYVAEIEGLQASIRQLESVISDKDREIEQRGDVINGHLSTIAEKEARIESLQTNIGDFKSMSQRDATTTSTLASKIQQLDHQVSELQTELKRQQAETEQARSDRVAMQTEMEGEKEERLLLEQYLSNAREKLEAKVIEYERALKETNEKAIETLNTERQDMANKLKAQEESAYKAVESHKEDFATLQAVHDELMQAHLEMGKQLQNTIVSRDSTQSELAETKASLERANRELVKNYEEAIGSLKGSGEELKSRLASLTSDLQTSRTESQDLRNAFRAEKMALDETHREEVNALNATIAQLEKDSRKQEQHVQMQILKIEALDQAISEQKRAISLLEASLAQRENMIQTRENTIQTRETTVHGLEAKVEHLERSKLELTGNCQSLQLKLEDAHAKIRDIERSLERERDVRVRGEERFEELKRTYEERLEDARVAAMQKQQHFDTKMSEKTAEFEAMKTRLTDESTQRITELNIQITAKSDELHVTKRDLNTVTTEKTRLEELYRIYRERTEEVGKETTLSFEATSQALVSKVKSLEENVMELSSNLRSRNSHIEDLEGAKKQLEEELAIVTRMRQRADEKIEVQGQRIELLESAKMNLMAEIQQKTIRSESHESVRKQLEAQVANMAQDMQRMDRTLLEKMNQIEALKKTVSSHETLIEETETRLRELEQDSFEMSRSGQLQSGRIVDMENAKRLVEEMLAREVEARGKLEVYSAKLEAQVTQLTGKQTQMEEEREREHALLLQRLDEHMQAAGSTIEGKNKEFQEMRLLYEGLKKQHAGALDARNRLQADYTALEAERDSLEEEMASLTAGFENRGALVAELEAKLLNFNPEMHRMSRTLEQREQQIVQLDAELQDLTTAFDMRGEKLTKVEDTLAKMSSTQEELQRVKAERDKLQKAVEVSITEVDSKERMLSEVEAALESLTSAYTNLQTEYTDLCADRNHMQNGLNEAQRTIKALKAQIME
eukprot:gene4452-8871_t